MRTPLELLRELRGRERALTLLECSESRGSFADLIDVESSAIIEARTQLGAVLLRSRFGHVWLARDEETAADISAEEADWEKIGESPIPVVTFMEVPRFRNMSPEMLRAVLDTRAVFSRSGVLQ